MHNKQKLKIIHLLKSLTFENFLQFVECEHGTKRVPMSDYFWPVYETVKDHKERIRSNNLDLAIEKKAHDNLKVALKVIDASEEENINFIKTIIKDIKHYYTMPKYTLRLLAFDVLSPNSAKAKWNQFYKELDYIKHRYGVDYLDRVLEKVKDKKDEVIIAIENRG